MSFVSLLKPLLTFSQMFGLAPFSWYHGRLHLNATSQIYSVVVLTVMLFLQSLIVQDFSGTTELASSRLTDMLDTYGFALTCLGAFLVQIYRADDACSLLNELIELHVGIPASSGHIMIDIVAGIIYEIVYATISIFVSPIDNLHYGYYILETLTYVALEVVGYITFLQFYHLVLACGRLFHSLNHELALVNSFQVREKNSVRFTRQLKRIMLKYAAVAGVCRRLNDVFALQNLFNVSLCCLEVTYSAYIGIFNEYDTSATNVMVDTSLWAGYFFYKLMATLTACSLTVSESQATVKLLLEVVHSIDDDAVSAEVSKAAFLFFSYLWVETFSVELLHTEVTFDAYGFFPLNFSLIYSITGAVASYLIILAQSHSKPELDSAMNCTI